MHVTALVALAMLAVAPLSADKGSFRKNLLHLVRAAHQRAMGIMPTIQYEGGSPWIRTAGHLPESTLLI